MKKNKRLVRGAGILMPISSLPSRWGIGTLGKEAYRFVDFLKAAGQRYWQVLPVGPTSYGDSPYQSFSSFAGNPYFIDLDFLATDGLLQEKEIQQFDWGEDPEQVDYEKIYHARFQVLHLAFQRSKHSTSSDYIDFCNQNISWLEDYSVYMALKFYFGGKEWLKWPEDIRMRIPSVQKEYELLLKEEINFWKFCQFQFFQQWKKLKTYANQNGIYIIGDIPIYVALDSADVWANKNLFQLKKDGTPECVAGVPPDMFSATGQLWGNPIYDWRKMKEQDFKWWKERIHFSACLYDVIRIDHFIGIVRYFSIPANSDTAACGKFYKGPGMDLIQAIDSACGNAKIIAEDLGVLSPAIRRMVSRSGYPGMKVFQFGVDVGPENEHMPHNYYENMVAYAGTHDNDTLFSFAMEKRGKTLQFLFDYLRVNRRKDIPWAVIRTLYGSAADTVMVQMQDFLCLPGKARINTPSTVGENWRWRIRDDQITDVLAEKISHLVWLYYR